MGQGGFQLSPQRGSRSPQSWVPLDVQVTFTLVGPVSPVLFGGSACSLVPGAAVAFRPVLGLAPRAPRLSPVFRLRLYSPSTAGL